MGLQVERSELVHEDHDVRGTSTPFRFADGKIVELEDAVLLRFEARVVTHLEGLDRLKRDALLAEQDPQDRVRAVIHNFNE